MRLSPASHATGAASRACCLTGGRLTNHPTRRPNTSFSLSLSLSLSFISLFFFFLFPGGEGSHFGFLFGKASALSTLHNALTMHASPMRDPRNRLRVRDAWGRTYREFGVRGFYKGYLPTILRAFPANGAAFLGIEFANRAMSDLSDSGGSY